MIRKALNIAMCATVWTVSAAATVYFYHFVLMLLWLRALVTLP